MDWLIPKYWKDFIDAEGKFDGQKFESLVSDLLPSIGLRLKETKISWDGARDFEDKKAKIWAECKMYHENVSIRVLSSTLVMAILHKPNKIYFFSYSKLNKNAVNHLCQFQDAAKLSIYIFDDSSLESLIFNNARTLKIYFPDFNVVKNSDLLLLDIRAGFSKDPEIEYYEDAIDDPRNKELYIYSVFSIDVFIRNHDIKNVLEGNIIVDVIEKTKSFLLLNKSVRNNNKKINLKIESGGIFFYRFYFKAIRSGKFNLPKLIFHNKKQRKLIKLNPNNVKVSSIIRTKLIGKKYNEILHRFKLSVQARHQPVFFNVFGESGTGKSRILKEYTEALFEEEFSILKYDGEDIEVSQFKEFIRKTFSKIYKLPLVYSEEYKNSTQNEFIYELLYSNEFEHTKRIAESVDFFLHGIESRKCALIIDNLQNFDEFTLAFIDNLITRCEQMSIRLVLVCCFNTNLIYEDTKNFEVFERLKLKGSQRNDVFNNEEIIGFSDKDFDLYLDNCVRSTANENEFPFSVKYPKTTALFKEKVLNRPLFIEQTLLYLEQEDAIARIHNEFYIKSIYKFHKVLNNKFPKNLFELISKRWEIFKSRLNKEAKRKYYLAESAIKFFSYFNIITYNHATAYGITAESINILKQNGFIEVDEKENISFYHYQLFLFFRKKIGDQSIAEYNSYRNYIENQNLSNKYFNQYFILLYKLNAVNRQHVQKAIQRIFFSFQYDDFLIEFSNSLFNILIDYNSHLGVKNDRILNTFLRIGKVIQIFQSMEDRQEILSKAYQHISLNQKKFIKEGASYFDFLHGYANSCITVHKDEKALFLLKKAISCQSKANFKNSKEKDNCIGKIYNRLCVIYKALGLNADAIQSGNISQKLATRTNDQDLIVRNYIDLANVYGRKLAYKNQILGLWKDAVSLYYAHPEQLKHQRAMVQLYESQIYILTNDYSRGMELLKDGVRYCEANYGYFFGVKYILLEIISEITFRNISQVEIDKLFQLTYKAKDWAIRYQINRTYWKVLFIEGRLYLLNNPKNISNASECFLQTLDILISLNSSAIEEYNYSLFEYLSYFFRDNFTKEFRDIFLLQCLKLKSTEIKNLISRIMNFTNKELESFHQLHKPSLIYNDGKFDFPIIG